MKLRTGLAAALGLFVLLSAANAQYFGRNKVRYRDFHFQILKTEHFDIYYYGSIKQRANSAAQMLERWHSRYVKIFHFPLRHEPVILYESPADLEQTNVIGGIIPQGVGGVTEGLARRIVVALTGINADDNHVLGHELVHAFQYYAMAQRKDPYGMGLSAPTWFIEGMAEYLSIGGEDAFTSMWMRDAVACGRAPTMAKAADDYQYFPYRYGQAIWAYITGVHGDASVSLLFDAVLKQGWNRGFQTTFNTKFDSLSKAWPRALKEAYSEKTNLGDTGSAIGKRLLGWESGYNLAPSLSPDGKYLAFVSTRDLFNFELYITDAATGKTVKKITSSTHEQHFEEISFINSSGAWSPDGKQFAIPVFRKGKNAIAVFDIGSKRMRQIVSLRNVDAIYQLSWSPDGRSLALFGTKDGYGHIYRYQFGSSEAEMLTDQGYSCIEPSWSPDGNSIVFATDQGPSTDLDSQVFGPLRIGIMDLRTRAVSTFAISGKAAHINPQYSPDGRSIYFVADPDGITNLYRYEIATGAFFKVTNVRTGVAGIEASSPAFSIAKDSAELVVNVFEHGNYGIYQVPDSARQGKPFTPADSLLSLRFAKNAGLAPTSGGKTVAAYLADHATGFPDTNRFKVEPYRPKLTSVTQSQAAVGAAVGGYGSAVGAGAMIFLCDELNDHQLGLALQINGQVDDIGGQVEYINQTKRINWGVGVGRVPMYYPTRLAQGNNRFFIGSIDSSRTDSSATPPRKIYDTSGTWKHADTSEWNRLVQENASIFAQYPLSTNQRIELSTGFTRYSFKGYREVDSFDINSNFLNSSNSDIAAPPTQNLFNVSLGYIGDYSFNGFTGPISGKAWHFEVAPTFGTLEYLSFYADYRYYWFLRPLTIAFRALHYGSYGLGSGHDNDEADTLNYTFIGDNGIFRGFVRGYTFTQDSTFYRLLGSRIAIVNLEARFPFFGTKQYGLIDFKYLPTDLIAFLDGGIAWDSRHPPSLKLSSSSPAQRIPVFSAGVGARFNVFGALIVETDLAFPFQNEEKKPVFAFSLLMPGW